MEGVAGGGGVFHELKGDKPLLFLLIAIIILGSYLRVADYNKEGLWNDDMANVPAGLLWFYPHSYFPAFSSGNFPLGNLVIGAGCMLSGEDFSGVSKVKPMFYPGREILIGEALTKGEWGCHLPMYVFGFVFLFLIAILAFLLLDRYSATFVTAFFAFHPFLLGMSRWIRGDIVFWSLLIASFIFLWKAYNAEKCSKRELAFFVVSFSFLGLAHSAKETTPVFLAFAAVIFIDKYSSEFFCYVGKLLKKLDLKVAGRFSELNVNLKSFHKTILYSAVSYVFFFLLAFKLNPKNVYATYMVYKRFNGDISAMHFSLRGIFDYFYSFFLDINFLGAFLFIIALFLLVILVVKRGMSRLEKFMVYLSLFGIALSFFFKMMVVNRIAFPFLIPLVFLMGISLSKFASFFSKIFKVSQKAVFLIFMLSYVALSFWVAFSASPYFFSLNGAVCIFDRDWCYRETSLGLDGFSAKEVAAYIQPKLSDSETFFGPGLITHYYVKRSQVYTGYQFDNFFNQQAGRNPTLLERAEYFHPNNESIRYLFLRPYGDVFPGDKDFKDAYLPNDVFKMEGYPVFYVYDLKNLKTKD